MHKWWVKKPQRTSKCVRNGFFFVSAYNNRTFVPDEEEAVCKKLGEFNSVLFFKRLSIGHQIVHSTEYKSTPRRNNAIVKYKDDFDEAKTFVKVNVLALNHPMEKSTVTIPNCHYLQAATPYHGGLHQIEHFSSASERHLWCMCVRFVKAEHRS